MNPALFEAWAPVCPRCLHHDGRASALVIASRDEMRAGRLWHGMLHCSDRSCWMEFPVIDGVPVLTHDPAATLAMARSHISVRTDLPGDLATLLGEAAGSGSDYDTVRQHLSIYGWAHFSDWAGAGPAALPQVVEAVHALLPAPGEGMVLDLGSGPGRGALMLWQRLGRPVLAADLSFSFLRFAQALMLEGRATLALRRIGLAYDPVAIEVPEAMAGAEVDFWLCEGGAMPFRAGTAALVEAVNLVDCTPDPTGLLAETARLLAPGGALLLSTPYDWAPTATETRLWFGGHSQRGAGRGAGEPVLRATLAERGLVPEAEADDIPWRLRLHERATMEYRLHAVLARKAATSG